MKFLLLLLLFLTTRLYCFPQYNLVPNYSFEDSVICPDNINGNTIPKPWYVPSNFNTNSYVNSCSLIFAAGVPYNLIIDTSFQYAKTGNGYAVFDAYIPLNSRYYIQVRLKDSLQIGKCYNCTFWVSLGNPCGLATNNVSMWLTKTAQYSDTIADPLGLALIPGNPQVYNYGNPVIKDTQNWVKVSSIYVAQGGEQFITIGNFKNDANTVFANIGPNTANQTAYYVEDVSVNPLDSLPLKADAGPDTTIALGDSVFIGSLTNGITNIKWYNSSGAVINTTAPGLYVRPTASTFYVVEQTVCRYYSRDTVHVNVGAMPLKLLSFTANAVSNKTIKLNWQTANEFNVSHFNIQRSRTGGGNFTNIGKINANNKALNEYSFNDESPELAQHDQWFYRIQNVDKDWKESYSPVRGVVLHPKPPTLYIYPNPAKHSMNIAYAKMKEISINDVLGRVVLSKVLSGVNTLRVDVSHLPKGMYMLKVTGTNGVVETQKLIVQ